MGTELANEVVTAPGNLTVPKEGVVADATNSPKRKSVSGDSAAA